MLVKIKRTLGFINQHPLAKKHKLKAFWNLLIWQFKSSFNSSLQVVPFIGQTKFLAKKKLTGITGNIYTGLHEFQEMGFLLHFLRPNDCFFDIGANVGSYTLLAAGECKSQCIAFEPVPSTFKILEENIALNHLKNLVKLENSAVGKINGSIRFTSDQDTTNHILKVDDNYTASINIPIIRLDDYYPLFKPSMMKIDVEGFEQDVIDGASSILSDNQLKVIIIELIGVGNLYGFNEEKIYQDLLDYGFKTYLYDPFNRQLIESSKLNFDKNTIFIRDINFVLERLNTAKPFKIFNQSI